MKRFASHYLLIPAVGYMKQQVVEITDEGVVRGVFPLTEEIGHIRFDERNKRVHLLSDG